MRTKAGRAGQAVSRHRVYMPGPSLSHTTCWSTHPKNTGSSCPPLLSHPAYAALPRSPPTHPPALSLTLPVLPYPPCLPAAFRQRIQVIRQQFDEELRKVLQGVMLLLAGPEQATSGAAPAAGAGAVRQHPPLTLTHSLLLWICV